MVAPPVSPFTGANNVPPRTICFTESQFDVDDRLSMLIESFGAIDDAHAELRIAGDGPSRRSAEAATHDRRVHFLGEIDEEARRNELTAASSVALISPPSGWSHLGLAAMLAGTPLVTPLDAGGITEIVEHGVNGVLVEPTPQRLAWGIRHVASSPRLRWQLGLQAGDVEPPS